MPFAKYKILRVNAYKSVCATCDTHTGGVSIGMAPTADGEDVRALRELMAPARGAGKADHVMGAITLCE